MVAESGLVSATGSRINIDRVESNTLGIQTDLFEVQETGVYTNKDGTVSQQLRAGTRISYAQAFAFGLTEHAVEEGTPLPEGLAPNQIAEGHKIAALLKEAGYDLGDPTSPGESGEAKPQPKWYTDYVAKTEAAEGEVYERYDGETEAKFYERVTAPGE